MRLKVIIGIIILAAIAVGAWAAFGMGGKSDTYNTTSSGQNTYSTTNGNTSGTSATPTQTAAGKIIQIKTAADVGQYLADSSGMALYTYGADTPDVSNCSGSCLYNWPAYQPTSTSASLPANVSVITRSDGTKQYAYKGMPLYTFTSDSPGSVTGDGVENFHIAKP